MATRTDTTMHPAADLNHRATHRHTKRKDKTVMSTNTQPTPHGDGDQLSPADFQDPASPTTPALAEPAESAATRPNPRCHKDGIHHKWNCPSEGPCPYWSLRSN
jgi:hypothetical protein